MALYNATELHVFQNELLIFGYSKHTMNTFIRTNQHKKRKKNSTKTAIYSLSYIYIKQVVHQINS